jgi:hypothetical protein
MRKLNILIAGAVTALALFAVGCGGDDPPEVSVPKSDSEVVSPGGGALVVPNTFLTYEGEQYELIQLLQADFEDESEFKTIGEATDADIDFEGKLAVYERENDSDAVYTLSPSTEDDVAFWLRWRRN